jgi:H+/gluconate symporter-like permease
MGEKKMQHVAEVKKWLSEITEIALLLVAFGIVAQILLGDAVPFLGGITSNLMNVLNTLGEKGPIGLIALGVIIYLFKRKKG